MAQVHAGPPPEAALINGFASRPGFYTDCFVTRVPGQVDLQAFLHAFYSTPLFRLERWILRKALGVATSDTDLEALVAGESGSFAVWQLETRTEDQLVAKAVAGSDRTRSWFMVEPDDNGTRLYFGSVLEPGPQASAGQPPKLGMLFKLGIGPHRLYSRALLNGARKALC